MRAAFSLDFPTKNRYNSTRCLILPAFKKTGSENYHIERKKRTMKTMTDCFVMNNGNKIPCLGYGT